MDKTLHFISGLPRSGSTLLCNLLAQNPRFAVTPTSGLLEIVVRVRNQWDTIQEFQAVRDEAAKLRVLRAMLLHFHPWERPVVFDKNRAWPGYVELAERALERKIKILATVRDVREILASFEKLWRQNVHARQFPHEAKNYIKWQTVEGRCDIWSAPNQPLGMAYNWLKDALTRQKRDRLHFVHFDELTTAPAATLRRIYHFLGEAPFEHNFDHVEQATHEDDYAYGMPGLHDTRPKVEPVSTCWRDILGPAGEKYAGWELW
jgi:sulfotransferase